MPNDVKKAPLVATLKTAELELVQEVEIPLERFPDMIELPQQTASDDFRGRQFFRIGITDRRAFYREGTSYRIPILKTEGLTK